MTSRAPVVSVIVPTRNRAHLLPRALRSIYAQTGRGEQFELEVVVVDDASEDQTAEVVGRCPEVRLVRLPARRGIGGARNAGLAVSRGAYIAFLDDDDEWTPRKLALQLPPLAARPDVAAVYSQILVRFDGGQIVYPASAGPSGDIFKRLLFDNFCGTPAVPLIRRDALLAVGGFATDILSEDYDLWLRLAARYRFLFVPGAVAVYERSLGGAFVDSIRTGVYARDLRRVVQRALGAEQGRECAPNLARAALGTVELRVANGLVDVDEMQRAVEHLTRAAEIYPPLMHKPENQATVARIIAAHAKGSASPIAAASALWRDLVLARDTAAAPRTQPRRVLSDALWGIAVSRSRGAGCRPDGRIAAHAAVRALMAYPFDLRLLGWARLAGYPVLRRMGLRRRSRSISGGAGAAGAGRPSGG